MSLAHFQDAMVRLITDPDFRDHIAAGHARRAQGRCIDGQLRAAICDMRRAVDPRDVPLA